MAETTNESKKRKMMSIGNNVDGGDHEHENDEEEKVEKFFALINNIREARGRLMNCSKSNVSKGLDQNNIDNRSSSDKKKKRKKKVEEEEEKVVVVAHQVWEPSFLPEDLIEEEPQFKIPQLISAGSSSKKENSKEGNLDLDLRLSL